MSATRRERRTDCEQPFQAVTSFVRAIQLGGKGYAPAQSDPLRKHVKGLSNFVQFLDNLEEILGEIPDPRYTAQLHPLTSCLSAEVPASFSLREC